MKKRLLARTSLELSEVGFGCGKLAAIAGPNSALEAGRTVMEAYECGITFYDTADIYGQGRSEEVLGKAFGSTRHSVVIATKAGYQLGHAASLGAKLKPVLKPLIKRFASSVSGKHSCLVISNAGCRMTDQMNSTHQGLTTFLKQQRLHGCVNRN